VELILPTGLMCVCVCMRVFACVCMYVGGWEKNMTAYEQSGTQLKIKYIPEKQGQ